MNLPLLSVNVGLPRVIAEVDGIGVVSGIAKSPVAGPSIAVAFTQIEGDGQADLSVHGGADKAVYAYPTTNWPWWQQVHAVGCEPGSMGENLTLEGATEDDIAIGDRFRWGTVLLEVSQPRAPCYKLALHTRRPDVPGLMTASARCGWYLRVLEEGSGAVYGTLVRERASGGPSIRETFRALFDRRTPPERIAEIASHPALAEIWSKALRKALP
ncbi:MAG: MOSC domain-containing protein [Alphaproteobacteria bacterium]|nr:MOSC domain-containing protein [Alphaproteobacteria bacterium]